MKTFFKFFAVIAIIASFTGVGVAQQTFTKTDGSSITIYQDSWAQKSAQAQAGWLDTAQKSYLAQFVVGGGTGYANGFRLLNGYETAIRFDNNCDHPASAAIIWASDGQQFPTKSQVGLAFTNLLDTVIEAVSMSSRSADEAVFTLPQTEIKTGYVMVLNETFGSQQTCITVSSVIRHKTNGVIDAQAAVFPMIPSRAFSFHVRFTRITNTPPYDEVQTGVAFMNPGPIFGDPGNPISALVTLTLYDDLGRQMATTQITIQPGYQLARFVSELFPILLRENGFQGSIEISSNVPIAATILELSGFNFSAGVIGPARPIITP